ncbi:hypothetical protein [Algiphilus sp.]|uniref:hypothetical protein n=1 Tax=Algiphilus sp. TaxID=1872431 RepID=UPI0032EAD19D
MSAETNALSHSLGESTSAIGYAIRNGDPQATLSAIRHMEKLLEDDLSACASHFEEILSWSAEDGHHTDREAVRMFDKHIRPLKLRASCDEAICARTESLYVLTSIAALTLGDDRSDEATREVARYQRESRSIFNAAWRTWSEAHPPRLFTGAPQ